MTRNAGLGAALVGWILLLGAGGVRSEEPVAAPSSDAEYARFLKALELESADDLSR